MHLARAEFFEQTGDIQQAGQQLDLALQRAGGNFVISSRIKEQQNELQRQRELIESL